MQATEELSKFLSRPPTRIIDGIPSFLNEDLRGQEARWNWIYDGLAPFYEHTERFLGGLILGVDFRKEWERVVQSVGLKPGVTVLEVSPGPGVYQPFLRRAIGSEGTLLSLDLSLGMLRACERRSRRQETGPLLLHGTGSDLPLQDNIVDVVFHIGGINLFSSPEKAISEFARVTKPGGVVVIGDEGFSPDFSNELRRKILSKMNPGFLTSKIPELPKSLEKKNLQWFFGGCLYVLTTLKQ